MTFKHIQKLDYAGLNTVAKTIEIAPDDINTGTKIALLKVVLIFLSLVDIEKHECSDIFKHIEAFIHNNYKMTPISSPNYLLLTKANELNKKKHLKISVRISATKSSAI